MFQIDNYLLVHSESVIQLNTPNTRRNFFKQLFFAFIAMSAIFDLIFIQTGFSFLELFYQDYDTSVFAWMLHLPMVATLVLWLTTNPSWVFFDRSRASVVLKTGKHEIAFPWQSIRFDVQWIPTKIGGTNYLSIKAGSPFPEIISIKLKKNLETSISKDRFIGLGGFDCRNVDIANSYVKFFSEFMGSDLPVVDLYRDSIGNLK